MKKILSKITLYFSLIVMMFWSFSCSEDEQLENEMIRQSLESHEGKVGDLIKYKKSTPIENQYVIILNKEKILTTFEEEEMALDQRYLQQPVAAYARQTANVKRIASDILSEVQLPAERIRESFAGEFPGIIANISFEEAERLAKDDRVEVIEQDQVIALTVWANSKTPVIPSSWMRYWQITPYNVKKVGGSVNVENDAVLSKKKAWIVDSGIDMGHPELNVNEQLSANFTDEDDAEDEFGHGTHVAGIIGARANSVGVTGVAAGAELVSIRVLDEDGIGTVSELIAGLNYVDQHVSAGDVVNLSLATYISEAVESVVKSIAAKGAKVVIAAGNEQDVIYNYTPARLNGTNIYTIGAYDAYGYFADDFSNYGIGMDFLTPGVGILSTYLDGDYAIMTGTSMAAPHVAGILFVSPDSYSTNGTASTPEGNVGRMVH